ncbi:MAG: hypothetical protein OXK21_06895 [Chloroflexota bacterium]|nr:hypothetical protein [Chloroflexota bacterium]
MSTIGELNEGSLHRALKARYTATGSETERTIGGYVADVVSGGRIIEVQTGGFGPLRGKLERLLDAHPVTLVHPIAHDRYIVRLTDAGAETSRRKSPKHGTLFDVFTALVSIPALLAHPNLTLDVVMTVEEEVRAPTARRSWRRGPWTRVDRRLIDVVETHAIPSMSALFAMLDAALPEQFTTLELAAAMKSTRALAQQAAYCFRESGVTEISGKSGNALVYHRAG